MSPSDMASDIWSIFMSFVCPASPSTGISQAMRHTHGVAVNYCAGTASSRVQLVS
ncbi:hypothetical protein VDGL01_10212 [Verticillium dahliae]